MQFIEPTPDIIITSKLNVNYTKPTSDTNPDDYIDNLINAIETHQLTNEEFNILKEHIDNRCFEYLEFEFEIDSESLEDLEK